MTYRNLYRFAPVRALALATLFAIARTSRTSMMVTALWLCASSPLPAQTFTTLYLFGAGGNPDAGLVQGTDGNLYGVTAGGPAKEDGTIYKITQAARSRGCTAAAANTPRRWFKEPTGTSTGQCLRVGPSTMARSSKSPRVARSRRCTTSASRMASSQAGWSKPATGTSTGRRRRVEPTPASLVAPTMVAGRSTKSPPAAR